MEEKFYSFNNYRNDFYKKWQKRILLIDFYTALAVLLVENIIFVLICCNEDAVINTVPYFIFRVVTPSVLNFGTLLLAVYCNNSRKFQIKSKNRIVCFATFLILANIAIFHNYYNLLLLTTGFSFFICAIFGDSKILKHMYIASGPAFILSAITFLLDPEAGPYLYRTIVLICAFFFLVFSIIFSWSLVKSLANHLLFIQNSYKRQTELIEELKIDPLTQIFNRKAMDDALNLIMTEERISNNLYLSMLDLDFFKRVNDKYGHSSGDCVLRTLSEIIARNVGGRKNSFRFGGEEFVIILESQSLEDLLEILEQIRSEYSDYRFSFAPDESFTLSIGVAAYSSNFSPKQWIDAADAALYRAKNSGRNQIQIAE